MQHHHTHKVSGRVQTAPGGGPGQGPGFYHGPKEQMLGAGVMHHSPARLAKKGKSRRLVEAAMEEVHEDIPSTVRRADVAGEDKEAMLRAIALSKARKAGARIPKRGRR